MDFAASKHSDIAAFFANKTLLITGGTGFIGKVSFVAYVIYILIYILIYIFNIYILRKNV